MKDGPGQWKALCGSLLWVILLSEDFPPDFDFGFSGGSLIAFQIWSVGFKIDIPFVIGWTGVTIRCIGNIKSSM